MRKAWLLSFPALCCLALVPPAGVADYVQTTDGSRIVGTVMRLADGKLVITTEFAGEVKIEIAQVVTVATEGAFSVELAGGDRLVGPLQATSEAQKSVVSSTVGEVEIAWDQVTYAWPEGEESPELQAVRAEAGAETARYKPKWSATLEAGVTRKEGNTDSLEARGKFVVRRKTADDLLKFYAAADYSEINEARNRNEYLGGVFYESNITERWNWYARGELEYDEFEGIDLRATAAAGMGYYWLKESDHEFKTRAGAGYRHEAYASGFTSDAAILDLGYDYRLDLRTWAQFTHELTYSPDVEETADYRLVVDTAVAIPLANSDAWKLKLGVMNEYNSRPQPGIDRLDNTYYANIVLELK